MAVDVLDPTGKVFAGDGAQQAQRGDAADLVEVQVDARKFRSCASRMGSPRLAHSSIEISPAGRAAAAPARIGIVNRVIDPDGALRAVAYAPSDVRTHVDGTEVVVHVETDYPNWIPVPGAPGLDGAEAAPPPPSPVFELGSISHVRLIPYGSARIRISEFPVAGVELGGA